MMPGLARLARREVALTFSALVWSAVANTLGLVLLVGADWILGFPVSVDKLLLLCLYQGAAILVAWFATGWFIGTLRQASLDSVRAERARTGGWQPPHRFRDRRGARVVMPLRAELELAETSTERIPG